MVFGIGRAGGNFSFEALGGAPFLYVSWLWGLLGSFLSSFFGSLSDFFGVSPRSTKTKLGALKHCKTQVSELVALSEEHETKCLGDLPILYTVQHFCCFLSGKCIPYSTF